jgi:autotransporter strand-loop-strand O-heptosyltransferase
MIRTAGYTPVVIEKDELFGVGPEWNGLPKKAQKKIGLDLKETINLIEHSEFFIGLSSGLSWLAHALGKPVAMISNFTEDWHEFDILTKDYKRIVNKSVCHGCWNRVGIEYEFDVNDWYWCPRHRGTSRQFECHTSITPEYVFNEIKNWL